MKIDRSKARYEDINNFNKLIREKLMINNKFNVEIHHNYSHNHESIQIVDVVTWSFFQKFERNNSEFVDLIKLKINVKEL